MPAASMTRAAVAVEDRMVRALAVLRVVVLAYALVVNAYRMSSGRPYEHPGIAVALLAGMVVWTGVVIAICAVPERRTPAVLALDLALATGLVLVTPVVKGPWFGATLPGYWIMGALLACAVRFGWLGGLVAALVLGGSDLLSRAETDQGDYANVFLLVIGGPIVGFLCASLQQMAGERDLAQREAAAAEERVRLGRAVHDGVLQVLALVQRRGAEIGGETAELGRLAGEQERALRGLIRSQDAVRRPDDPGAGGTADVSALLEAVARRTGADLVVPGGPVDLPAHAAAELAAAVGACLDNVARHVGEDAPAWVLVEDLGDRVVVSVRDEGPGIPEGRLDVAAGSGRLGVSQSIRGRVEDLGGTASLSTGSYGTEWELTVPREAPR